MGYDKGMVHGAQGPLQLVLRYVQHVEDGNFIPSTLDVGAQNRRQYGDNEFVDTQAAKGGWSGLNIIIYQGQILFAGLWNCSVFVVCLHFLQQFSARMDTCTTRGIFQKTPANR